MTTRFAARTREQVHRDLWTAKREVVKRFFRKKPHVQQRLSKGGVYVAKAEPEHNIIGVGVGRKYSKGKGTPDYAVRVYVRHKLPLSQLGRHAIPKTIGGVPTDIFETGRFHALADSMSLARMRTRPVCPGASVGFVKTDGQLVAGTITAIVERAGAEYLLSNNHVLAFENRLPLGFDIIQPGTLDDGRDPADRVGALADVVQLTSEGNEFDAALSSIDGGIATTPQFAYRLRLASGDPVDAKAQMLVAKVGRGSGYTEGSIFDLGIDVDVDFETGAFSFVDQLLIQGNSGSFAELGDSGSLVVTANAPTAPVAMLFATSAQYALATPIGRVLEALNVSIVT